MSGDRRSISAMLYVHVETGGKVAEQNMRFSYFIYPNLHLTIDEIEAKINELVPRTMNDTQYVIKLEHPESGMHLPLTAQWMEMSIKRHDVKKIHVFIKSVDNPKNNIRVFFVNLRWRLGREKFSGAQRPPENVEIFMVKNTRGGFYTLPTFREPVTESYIKHKLNHNPILTQIPSSFIEQYPVFACICNNEIFEELANDGEWLKYEDVKSEIRGGSTLFGYNISNLLKGVSRHIHDMATKDTPLGPRVVNTYGDERPLPRQFERQDSRKGGVSTTKYVTVIFRRHEIRDKVDKIIGRDEKYIPCDPKYDDFMTRIFELFKKDFTRKNTSQFIRINKGGPGSDLIPLDEEAFKANKISTVFIDFYEATPRRSFLPWRR